MKRVIMLLAGLMCLATMMFGCAYTHLSIADSSYEKPFEVVGHTEGKVEVFHLFGLIGLKKQADLHQDIQKELDRMAAEKGGDACINIRYVERDEFYVVVTRFVTFIEADVIKYID